MLQIILTLVIFVLLIIPIGRYMFHTPSCTKR